MEMSGRVIGRVGRPALRISTCDPRARAPYVPGSLPSPPSVYSALPPLERPLWLSRARSGNGCAPLRHEGVRRLEAQLVGALVVQPEHLDDEILELSLLRIRLQVEDGHGIDRL